MKPSDFALLKSKLPLSASTIARNVVDRAEGDRATASVQEQQNADAGQVDNRAQETAMDESGPGAHRMSIIVQVSDKRQRDGDGCEATILDCLVAARKRLLSLPDGMLMALYASAKETGGRIDPR